VGLLCPAIEFSWSGFTADVLQICSYPSMVLAHVPRRPNSARLCSSSHEFLSATSHCQKVVAKVFGSSVCSFEFFNCVYAVVRIIAGEARF
jgi:hypothetical protein